MPEKDTDEKKPKTYAAKEIRYTLSCLTLGSGMGPDKDTHRPARAIYVPSAEVFTRTATNKWEAGPGGVNIYVGEEAKVSFERLKLKLLESPGAEGSLEEDIINDIEVPTSFVEWCKAAHTVENPSDEVKELLKSM